MAALPRRFRWPRFHVRTPGCRVAAGAPAASAPLALLVLPAVVTTTRAPAASAAEPGGYLSFTPVGDGFALAANGRAAPLFVDGGDHAGVVRVVGDFRDDVERVTGARPTVSTGAPSSGEAVLIGTVGRSALVDGLVAAGKLDVEDPRQVGDLAAAGREQPAAGRAGRW